MINEYIIEMPNEQPISKRKQIIFNHCLCCMSAFITMCLTLPCWICYCLIPKDDF